MPASACLRILLDLSDEQFAKLDALGPLVSKVTSAFLETRWSWPKRHAVVTPFSFMLTDPKAMEVDVARLERLAEELQLKLFGTSNGGDVMLVLHEGEEADTAQFVKMGHAELKKAIKAPIGPTPFGGRLMTLAAATDLSQGMRWEELTRLPAEADSTAGGTTDTAGATTYRSIYCPPRQTFVADHIFTTPMTASSRLSLIDGVDELPGAQAEEFDIASITAAAWMLEEAAFVGALYVPVCFSSLMRRSVRENYEDFFARFLEGKRRRLVAAIYDTPRSPGFQAFAQFQASLGPYFGSIDLQITDPGFEIEHVPAGAVTSVTLRLPEAESRVRMAALKRLTERRDDYKRRQIWPAITNVRTRAELQACVRERTPFISGSAVCGLMDRPVGRLACESTHLPLVLPASPLAEAI